MQLQLVQVDLVVAVKQMVQTVLTQYFLPSFQMAAEVVTAMYLHIMDEMVDLVVELRKQEQAVLVTLLT
jgi:hypothetical protein